MREILFKAKRVDDGKWVEGLLARYGKSTEYANIINEHEILVPVYANTVCQYTGLTDKNGMKIWENDIVEIPREDDCFRIEWQEDTASFVMNNDSFSVTFDNYWSYETEVISNVFNESEVRCE